MVYEFEVPWKDGVLKIKKYDLPKSGASDYLVLGYEQDGVDLLVEIKDQRGCRAHLRGFKETTADGSKRSSFEPSCRIKFPRPSMHR